MIFIREYKEDSMERTYRICEPTQSQLDSPHKDNIINIDESDLAWFYVAPGHESSASCRRLLTMARDLIGPNAWIVVQAGDTQCIALCRELGLRVMESYENEAPGLFGVSVHLVQTT